jgi:drug/metabolite transporter (DMT)-like permease
VRGYLTLLLTLAAIWGASFMFIEVALEDLEPATLMAARVLIAAAALLTMLAVRGSLASLRRAGWQGFALGLINSALPFTLIAWGQQYIDSGVAAIANASVPIWVAVFAIWMRHSERATGARLLGIVLGLVGVGILTGAQPDVTGKAMIGTLAVVVASICYGLGSLLLQDRMDDLDPLTLSTAAVCGAAIVLLPFGLAQLPGHAPDAETVWSVVALGLAGTAVGMVMFLRIIESYGSFRAGLVTYLLPVTALLYGALLLGEPVNGWMLFGLALILSGVALGSGLVRPARAPEVAEAAPP